MAVLRVQSWSVKHTDPESKVSAAGETGIGGRPIEDSLSKDEKAHSTQVTV